MNDFFVDLFLHILWQPSCHQFARRCKKRNWNNFSYNLKQTNNQKKNTYENYVKEWWKTHWCFYTLSIFGCVPVCLKSSRVAPKNWSHEWCLPVYHETQHYTTQTFLFSLAFLSWKLSVLLSIAPPIL